LVGVEPHRIGEHLLMEIDLVESVPPRDAAHGPGERGMPRENALAARKLSDEGFKDLGP
jgi:hypothetical protein